MSDTAEDKPGKGHRQAPRRADTYHGVRLAPARDTPNFTVEEIRRAVDHAVEKNRDILAKRK